MRYWDASSLVPLIVRQRKSDEMLSLYREDPDVCTWWGTCVECYSALMRLHRESAIDGHGVIAAENRLNTLREHWTEVIPHDSLRRTAWRMLRVHSLRAADALQLAAALTASGHQPEGLPFLGLDRQLNTAVAREGFPLL